MMALRDLMNFYRLFTGHLLLKKHLIAKELRKYSKILMPGDGINDLLAIKQADVGVSLEQGCDLSKEVSDVILTDSNINNILYLIQSGRRAFHNVQSVLKYLISSNLEEVTAVFFSILNKKEKILNSNQLLFINLLTDGLPATLLSMNRSYGGCKFLSIRVILIALYLGICTFLISDMTKSFLFLVIGEMFNSLNNINLRRSIVFSYKENLYVVAVVIITLLWLYFSAYINLFAFILSIKRLKLHEYIKLMVYAFPVILIDEFFKQFFLLSVIFYDRKKKFK